MALTAGSEAMERAAVPSAASDVRRDWRNDFDGQLSASFSSLKPHCHWVKSTSLGGGKRTRDQKP